MAIIDPYISKDTGEIVSYRFRACVGRDEYGKQVWSAVTIPNDESLSKLTPKKLQAELERRHSNWVKTEKEKFKNDVTNLGDKEKFASFVRGYWWESHVLHNKKGKLSQLTIDFYRIITDQILEAPQFKNRNLKAITVKDIDSYIISLKDKGVAMSTVKHHFDVLRIIFNYAEQKDFIEKNPVRKADPVTLEHKQPTRLTNADKEAFMAALDEHADLRHRAMMIVLLEVGLRRGELAGLTWDNVDFANKTITIAKTVVYSTSEGLIIKEPKSTNSKRILPVPESVVSVLKDWKAEQEESAMLLPTSFVFPDFENAYMPINPQSITKWSRRFSERHGLEHINPHKLRHTFGSMATSKGAPLTAVSRYMGHSTTSITSKAYIRLDTDDLRSVADIMEDVANG